MATYSSSLKLTLLADGEQPGTWGQTQNNNLGTLLEQAITGVRTVTMLDQDYVLSSLNGASDEARNAVIIAVGNNSAVRKIVAPKVQKLYTIVNNTSGGKAITVGASTGSYVTIPNGYTNLVYCDGANFYPGVTIPQGGTATELVTTNWTVKQSGSDLVFQYNGSTFATLNSSGQWVVG